MPFAYTKGLEELSALETVSLEEGCIAFSNPEKSVAAAISRITLSDLQKVYVEFSTMLRVGVNRKLSTIAITKNKKRNQNLLDFDCA